VKVFFCLPSDANHSVYEIVSVYSIACVKCWV